MSGISSKAVSSIETKQKFQGQELDEELDINLYEFKWRSHDPQIGRFIQIDPLADKYSYNSTYAFSENKVVAHRELEGLEAVVAWQSIFEEKNDYPTAYYNERVLHPDDADPQYGHNGKLTHYLYFDLKGNMTQIDTYQPDPSRKKKGLFPQIILYGSGKNHGFEMGSPWDPEGGKTITMNFGALGGEDNDFGILDLLDVLKKIPNEYGTPEDIKEYLLEELPGMVKDVGEQANKYKHSPNAKVCLTCNGDSAHGLPYVNTGSDGVANDTVVPPGFRNNNDTLVIPNRDRGPRHDSPGLDKHGRPINRIQKN